MKEFSIFRGYLAAKRRLLKAVSLQPIKFHVISTLSPMISTSVFLPCVMISGVHESLGRSWQSVLHQSEYYNTHFDVVSRGVCVCVFFFFNLFFFISSLRWSVISQNLKRGECNYLLFIYVIKSKKDNIG